MAFDCTVFFIKEDEVWGRVQTDDFDFLCMLRDHLSFFADGYKFAPSYRNHFWDGKIHMLSESGRLHLGLWSEVVQFCKRHDQPFKVDPQIRKFSLDKDKFQGFVDKLDCRDDGDKIPPYEYQVDAAHKALEWQRCILESPTSSGKSLIQYMLVRMYEKLIVGEQMLMVVPTVALVSQMSDDFNNYSSEMEWEAFDEIHQITAGVCKETGKRIVISTYQSLQNMDAEYFLKFKAVMVDEVHTAKSKSIVNILEACVNAAWRVGLTGTLDECKTNLMTLKGLFGPVFTVITTKELMDMNRVAQLKVTVALLKYPENDCKFMRSAPRGEDPETGKATRKKATYQEEIDFIVNSKERNLHIMRFASKLEGNTIVMINKVEHGENLYVWMKEALPDRDIYLYTGTTKKSERESIRKLMEEKENAIIIGSLGVLSTGISIKRLHNLVFAHPSKSRIKVLQSVGRILRKSKFGNNVNMYDFVDDMCIGAFTNYVYGHGQARVRFYNDQQFDYSVIKLDL